MRKNSIPIALFAFLAAWSPFACEPPVAPQDAGKEAKTQEDAASQPQQMAASAGADAGGTALGLPGFSDPGGPKKTAAPSWTHAIAVQNPGSRSEYLQGRLSFEGVDIPEGAGRLAAAGYVWEYVQPRHAWAFRGWKVAGDAPPTAVEGSPVTAAELEKGSVDGGWEAKRPGIPSSWITVAKDGKVVWADPRTAFPKDRP